ncbi:HTH domain-containing protein [Candidatus Woesearchaeota archaeon]|nr:HTH domain-containing protein [Candidatus Woesearchaeota archaeon]
MKKTEIIYREILYKVIENKETAFTQSDLSKKFNISLSVVNLAVKKLESLGSVKVMLRSFKIINTKKALIFWASARNLEKDIVFKTRIEFPVREIERLMPNIIFTAYTAYKLRFNDVPSDYSEVYAYADEEEIREIKKRISKIKTSEKNPNLFILKKDDFLPDYKSLPISQLYVDLWNLKEWYSKEFLDALEKRMGI